MTRKKESFGTITPNVGEKKQTYGFSIQCDSNIFEIEACLDRIIEKIEKLKSSKITIDFRYLQSNMNTSNYKKEAEEAIKVLTDMINGFSDGENNPPKE